MAANGITIKPMRMADIMSQADKSELVRGKYTPPSKRTGAAAEQAINIDMSDKNFPAIGSVAKKMPAWGKHIVQQAPVIKVEPVVKVSPEPARESLCDKLKEKIRLDAIADEDRLREAETDPWKMTNEELDLSGWVKLNLSSAKNIRLHGFSMKEDSPLQKITLPSAVEIEEYSDYEELY